MIPTAIKRLSGKDDQIAHMLCEQRSVKEMAKVFTVTESRMANWINKRPNIALRYNEIRKFKEK